MDVAVTDGDTGPDRYDDDPRPVTLAEGLHAGLSVGTGEEDVYGVELTPGDRVTVLLVSAAGGDAPAVSLAGPAGRELAAESGPGQFGAKQVTATAVRAGVHELRVAAPGEAATYTLGVTVSEEAFDPFDAPAPGSGAAGVPADLDGDGRFEDVDGDGEATFDDAVALAFVDAAALTPLQTAALDFDDDGDVDAADATALAFAV
jgi:hypothetical protein